VLCCAVLCCAVLCWPVRSYRLIVDVAYVCIDDGGVTTEPF
jgi:hypothetical protein